MGYMKRSEMVTRIAQIIEINIEALSEVPDAQIVASVILEVQENLGMLPPKRPEQDLDCMTTFLVNKWEEE